VAAERVSFDANVLFYAVDRDAGERHRRAAELVRRAALRWDCVLVLQALCEFVAAVTRKERMPFADAQAQVEDWQTLFPVAHANPSTLGHALRGVRRHGLSFWDAMLWAAAKEAGVTVILSEDFQPGRELEGVRFADPFAAGEEFNLGAGPAGS
jgi:predicted nucleic acid-binding protein